MEKGRKQMYTPERVRRICEAIERGETDATAARIGGISPQTFCEWKNRHPEFLESVKKAEQAFEEWQLSGILADAKKSLKTLICGMEYEEVRTEYEPDANGDPKVKRQSRTTKRVPPNAAAIIFALTNRDPDNWKNRLNNEISGKVETESKADVSLANVPDELLQQVIEAINRK